MSALVLPNHGLLLPPWVRKSRESALRQSARKVVGIMQTVGLFANNFIVIPGGDGVLRSNDPTGAYGQYVATHYVAPYADVTGATSDEDVMDSGGDGGAAAFAAASNPSQPCTLMCAVRNAIAGNRPRLYPGIFDSLAVSNLPESFTARFHVLNAGTAEQPILFFCQYPAAYYYNQPSLLTIFRQTYGEAGGTNPDPFFGMTTDYVILDGPHINTNDTTPAEEEGVILVGGRSIGCEVRRIWVDMNDVSYSTGENKSAVFFNNCQNPRLVDSRFTGNESNGQHNSAALELRWADGAIAEHNYFNGVTPLWNKAENVGFTVPDPFHYHQNCHFRYNLVVNAKPYAFKTQTVRSTYVYQNIFHASYDSLLHLQGPVKEIDCPTFIWNNLLIGEGVAQSNSALLFFEANLHAAGSQFHSNILVDAGTNYMRYTEGAPLSTAELDQWDIYDRNVYHVLSGSPAWEVNYTGYNGMAAWQAYAATFGAQPHDNETYESNSSASDPEFVSPDYVNPENGDWRLQNNSQPARTIGLSSVNGGICGPYITGNEEIGVRADPSY